MYIFLYLNHFFFFFFNFRALILILAVIIILIEEVSLTFATIAEEFLPIEVILYLTIFLTSVALVRLAEQIRPHIEALLS